MADEDEKAIADFYDGLSPEDQTECARDVLAWGSAYVRVGDDGVKRRVPPSQWADRLGLEPPGERMAKLNQADAFWWLTPEETKPRG